MKRPNWKHMTQRIFCAAIIGVLLTPLAHADIGSDIQDPKLKSCLHKTAKKNNWQNAEDVSHLKCHSFGIQSLVGLEQFYKLETLSLYNNKLEYVDIDLAKFANLRELNIARNRLKKADINGLSKLSKLFLFGNQLRSLSLADLTSLESLRANNNKIEVFNYSNLPELKKIYIFNNQLEKVDIYGFPSLQHMDCRENPMPDELYDAMDQVENVTFLHDGNAEDW